MKTPSKDDLRGLERTLSNIRLSNTWAVAHARLTEPVLQGALKQVFSLLLKHMGTWEPLVREVKTEAKWTRQLKTYSVEQYNLMAQADAVGHVQAIEMLVMRLRYHLYPIGPEAVDKKP